MPRRPVLLEEPHRILRALATLLGLIPGRKLRKSWVFIGET